MEKLNFFGAGPKIGRITLPWLVITIILTIKFNSLFHFEADDERLHLFLGSALLFTGILLYFLTLRVLLKGLKETKLMTTGGFYFCCNPLYASIILFMVPGTAFLMNSWLILTTSIAGYVVFKIYIKSEQEEMKKFFGKSYDEYAKITPEFFPFPIKKWLK